MILMFMMIKYKDFDFIFFVKFNKEIIISIRINFYYLNNWVLLYIYMILYL